MKQYYCIFNNKDCVEYISECMSEITSYLMTKAKKNIEKDDDNDNNDNEKSFKEEMESFIENYSVDKVIKNKGSCMTLQYKLELRTTENDCSIVLVPVE
jgi:hypothetical protein